MGSKKVLIKDDILIKKYFGKLEAIKLSDKKDKVWCKCSCGNFREFNLYAVYKGETTCCGCSRGVKGLVIGETYSSNSYGDFIVTAIKNYYEVSVTFTDTGYKGVFTAGACRSGSIADPMHISVMGAGYLGVGKYVSRFDGNKKKTPQYRCWENMMGRCYYEKTPRYEAYGGKGVFVCEEWLNYQNFAKWFDDNFKEGCDLDKDILGDGMSYSPEVCRFIPQKLNKLLTTSPTRLNRRDNNLPEGVVPNGNSGYIASFGDHFYEKFPDSKSASDAYIRAKTEYIVALVEELHDNNSIGEDVYETMKDYNAEVGHK